MDVRKSLTYVFEDPKWVAKLLIGLLLALFSFLIIPTFILAGYIIAIMRRVMHGDKEPLPEWEDWGKLFKDGFLVVMAQLVYALPFILLLLVTMGMTIGFGGLSEVNEDLAAAGFMATFGLVSCVGLLFAVALLFITPAIYIQYADKDDFGATFRFGEVFGIARDNLGDILITLLVIVAASLGIGLVGAALSIIPCLGWIAAAIISLAATPYINMVTGHLYGQIAAKELGNKDTYIPETPGA